MRGKRILTFSCVILGLSGILGCSQSDSASSSPESVIPFSNVEASNTSQPILPPHGGWTVPNHKIDSGCLGRRFGTYTWDMSYFRAGNVDLINLLESEVGRLYACGDLYLNVADYSSPDVIPDADRLIDFVKEFRVKISNPEAIVYLTYGDVTARDGAAMITFTHTFFDWAMSISATDAALMGKIGISFDVEHINPEDSKAALLLCQELRSKTVFGQNLSIQHTIDGDRNILSTEYVFRYADSALAMLYSNRPDGLLDLIEWLLTTQCEKCLLDDYARTNYKAKISIILEASCKMGRGCSDKSMCVRDNESEGMMYIAETVDEANRLLGASGLLTLEQFTRLFNLNTQWVVHNFEWERCFAPFNKYFNYESCKDYHQYAKSCREL
jgi:hypothetical protein